MDVLLTTTLASNNTTLHDSDLVMIETARENGAILLVKLLAGAVLLGVSLAFGLSPLFCLRRYMTNPETSRKAETALGLAACLAAGVFLGVCLLDLLPDVQESMEIGLDQLDIHMSFPFAELSMAVGFFFILTIETVISMVTSPGQSMHSHSHRISSSRRQYEMIAGIENSVSDDSETELSTVNIAEESTAPCIPPPEPTPNMVGHIHEIDDSGIQETVANISKPFRAVILFAALSIHSIFEGLSIGAAQTEVAVGQLGLALIIHKPLESLSICLSLIRSMKRQTFVVKTIVLFSITCPIGVVIGAAVIGALSTGTSYLVTAILQGLAGGSFLYVVFVEVLPHEFLEMLEDNGKTETSHNHNDAASEMVLPPSNKSRARWLKFQKFLKLICLISGFALIALTKIILPHEHGE